MVQLPFGCCLRRHRRRFFFRCRCEESVETQSYDMCAGLVFCWPIFFFSYFCPIYQTQWPNDARWLSVNGTAPFIYFYYISCVCVCVSLSGWCAFLAFYLIAWHRWMLWFFFLSWIFLISHKLTQKMNNSVVSIFVEMKKRYSPLMRKRNEIKI